MTERAIIAYFNSPKQAEDARSRLQSVRVIDSRIDRIGQYPGSGVEGVMNPITGDFDSLGELTLSGDFTNRSAAILSAASPDASGMSDKGFDMIAGKDVCLTVVVNEEDFAEASAIVEQCGGMT